MPSENAPASDRLTRMPQKQQSNGGTAADASSHKAARLHAARESFRNDVAAETSGSRVGHQSPNTSFTSTAHKRTASGNPRPLSRTATGEERERRVERTQVTTRETLITRTRSPERRMASARAPPEKTSAPELVRSRPTESRPKETRSETSQCACVPWS